MDFLVSKNFEMRNIYFGYLCEVKKNEDKLEIITSDYTIGSLENDVFLDFIDQEEYKLIQIGESEKGHYEVGTFFVFPEKLYVKKLENIPGRKICPMEVFEDYKIKNEKFYNEIKRRVRENERSHY